MKKVFFSIVAIIATLSITSCNNGVKSNTGTTDSTAVTIDSLQIDSTKVDSLAPAVVPADPTGNPDKVEAVQ